MRRSTISGNGARTTVTTAGAGIHNGGTLTLTNSTVSNNVGSDARWGGREQLRRRTDHRQQHGDWEYRRAHDQEAADCLSHYGGTVTLKRSIVSGNRAAPRGREITVALGRRGYGGRLQPVRARWRRRHRGLHSGLHRYRAQRAHRRHLAATRRQRRRGRRRTRSRSAVRRSMPARTTPPVRRSISAATRARAGRRVTSARSRARRCSAMAGSRRWSAPIGPDELTGTPGADVISGLNGDDDIAGLGGNDLICAGGGADSVFGSSGNDVLFGQGGNDRLFGHAATTRSTAVPVRTNVMAESILGQGIPPLPARRSATCPEVTRR